MTCNQQIKFAGLLDTARDLGAAALATGHYVAARHGPDEPRALSSGDAERDQSYFLFATTPAQLQFLRFPLGTMHKADVRALARVFDLPVADKADSQDICFVPRGRYTDVIERLRPDAVGAGASCTSMAACSASTRALSTSRSASGAGSGLPMPSHCTLFASMLRAAR